MTCCLGNADAWLGILGMCSGDQGMFFQPLLLLPIPRVVLWTLHHYSQAQKRNPSLPFFNALSAGLITTNLSLRVSVCLVQGKVFHAV